MKWRSFILRLFASLAGLGVFLALLIGALAGAEVSIAVSPMRQAFLDAASRSLGREIQVDGEIRLAISYFPALLVNDVHISNDGEWQDKDFVHVEQARVQLALLPLFEGRLVLTEVMADGVTANFEQLSNEEKNWTVAPRNSSRAEEKPSGADERPQRIDDFSVEHFKLTKLSLQYRDQALGRHYSTQLDQLSMDAIGDAQMEIRLSSNSNRMAYDFSATSGLIRQLLRGEPWALDAKGHIDGRPLRLLVDTRSEDGLLEGQFKLTAEQLNFGKLLDSLNIAQGLDLFSDTLSINATIKGSSLKDVFTRSSFQLILSDGSWKPAGNTDTRIKEVRLKRAEILAVKTQDISVEFEGDIDGEPLTISFSSNSLSDYIRGLESARLGLAASFSGADLTAGGKLKLPVSAQIVSLDMSVSGARLDSWNGFLQEELPPYGPYKLNGEFNVSPTGFQVADFRSVIGESQLGGSIDIDTTGERPLWKMDLISETFQLNDFAVEGYSFIPGKEEGAASSSRSDKKAELQLRVAENRSSKQWDIDLSIRSKKMLSGEDLLGDGTIHLSTRQDEFNELFELNTPTGSISGEMGFKKVGQGMEGVLKLDMDRFDYGVALRRLDPENKTDGLLSARVDLKLAGKDYSHSLEHANGKLDFVIWPKGIDAEVMDIWAINVFFAIFPPLTDKQSKVNCLVSLLNVDDGKLQEEFFAVDSTKVWLKGNLAVDFATESVDLKLFPHAKKPRIFGIETPIQIKGSFDEHQAGIAPGGVAGSVVSFIFSPLHAPLRRIFGKEIPADASDTCGELLDREYLKSILAKLPKQPEKQWY